LLLPIQHHFVVQERGILVIKHEIIAINGIHLLAMDKKINKKAKFTIVNANDINTREYATPES
jgi:hypothetical protein